MLDAWSLNACQPHPQRGGGLRPPPFVDGSGRCSSITQQAASKHQASSSKHQASSIKQQASSIKHQAPKSSICFVTNQHTTEVEALLTRQISIIFRHASFPNFEIFRIPGFQFWKCWVWEVWYYQSGPKSVSINPYGILEPPKPLRNCQSLDWVQKTKKFESLAEIETFLKIRQGCIR